MSHQLAVVVHHDDLGRTRVATETDLRVEVHLVGLAVVDEDEHARGVLARGLVRGVDDAGQVVLAGCHDNEREHAAGGHLAALLA